MKPAIFGATGRTGQHLVEQALRAGHDVVALVRTPSKLDTDNTHLHVIQGDVQDAAQVEQVIAGVDAVLSVLGPTRNKPDFAVSNGMQNILGAMQKQGVRRLVISAGAGVGDPNDAPKVMHRLINLLLKLLSRYVYEDMLRVVEIVRKSDVDWTVVRVPMLTDDPASGNIRVGWVGIDTGVRLSRADMADFMLQQVNDNTYVRKAPVISN